MQYQPPAQKQVKRRMSGIITFNANASASSSSSSASSTTAAVKSSLSKVFMIKDEMDHGRNDDNKEENENKGEKSFNSNGINIMIDDKSNVIAIRSAS